MAEVRWTQQASDDLEAITEFIALDSPHYASLFVSDIFQTLERIETFPDCGRVVPETNDVSLRRSSSYGGQAKFFIRRYMS